MTNNTPPDPAVLRELIERVEAGERSNELDVRIEVALFRPDSFHRSVRANAAGTKVIYTSIAGHDSTHWADDWTQRPARTLASLRAHTSTPTMVENGDG